MRPPSALPCVDFTRSGPSPRLIHPPRGDGWWRIADRLVSSDGHSCWVHRPDGSRLYPVDGPIQVRDGHVVTDAGVLDPATGVLTPGTRDPRLSHGTGWSRDGEALPPAAASAWRPIAYEGGVLWTDGGHVWRAAGAVRAVGNAPRRARLSVGPTGAFVVGAEDYTDAAPPGRSAVAMPVRFDADHWGVRWSADGETVLGVDEHGKGWSYHIPTRALTALPGLPLDADTTVTDRIPGFDRPIVEASCARAGHLLAGPGGLVWDLRAAAPVADQPVIRLGGTFALDDRFGTIGWEDGEGAWVAHDGAVLGEFRIPLDEHDALDDAWAALGAGWVRTTGDRIFRVAPGVVSEEDDAPPPPRTARVGRRTKAGLDLGLAVALPADEAAVLGDRVFAWSQDGLLVSLAKDVTDR